MEKKKKSFILALYTEYWWLCIEEKCKACKLVLKYFKNYLLYILWLA